MITAVRFATWNGLSHDRNVICCIFNVNTRREGRILKLTQEMGIGAQFGGLPIVSVIKLKLTVCILRQVLLPRYPCDPAASSRRLLPSWTGCLMLRRPSGARLLGFNV